VAKLAHPVLAQTTSFTRLPEVLGHMSQLSMVASGQFKIREVPAAALGKSCAG